MEAVQKPCLTCLVRSVPGAASRQALLDEIEQERCRRWAALVRRGRPRTALALIREHVSGDFYLTTRDLQALIALDCQANRRP